MTKHQQIVNAFVTAMQGITGMATRVHIAKDPATVVPTDMPCIIVKDGRIETTRETLDGGMRNKLQLEVSYWATGSTAWQSALNGLDAMLTAFNTDTTLGGLVVIAEETGREIYTSQAGTVDAAGLIELALTYFTDAGTL